MISRDSRKVKYENGCTGRAGVKETGYVINSKGKKIKYPILKGRKLHDLLTDISSGGDFFIDCLDKHNLDYQLVWKHWCRLRNFKGKTFVDWDLCTRDLLKYFC